MPWNGETVRAIERHGTLAEPQDHDRASKEQFAFDMKQARLDESGRYLVEEGHTTRLRFLYDALREDHRGGSHEDASRFMLKIFKEHVTKVFASIILKSA